MAGSATPCGFSGYYDLRVGTVAGRMNDCTAWAVSGDESERESMLT